MELRLLTTSVVFYLLALCQPSCMSFSPDKIFKMDYSQVDSIKIEQWSEDRYMVINQKTITDKEFIKAFAEHVNNSKSILGKFPRNYGATVYYRNGENQVFIFNKNYFKVEGYYKMKKDIEELLKKYLSN